MFHYGQPEYYGKDPGDGKNNFTPVCLDFHNNSPWN
jgi:hypothetical protein